VTDGQRDKQTTAKTREALHAVAHKKNRMQIGFRVRLKQLI